MRLLLFVLGIPVLVIGIGSRAEAESYPWCAVYDGGDTSNNCGFVTVEQCRVTVSGIGGICEPNTQYQPTNSLQHPPRRAQKH
jgi:hypothetical protein